MDIFSYSRTLFNWIWSQCNCLYWCVNFFSIFFTIILLIQSWTVNFNRKLFHYPNMQAIGNNASYRWWNMLSRQGMLVFVESLFSPNYIKSHYTLQFMFDSLARSYNPQVILLPSGSTSDSLHSCKSEGANSNMPFLKFKLWLHMYFRILVQSAYDHNPCIKYEIWNFFYLLFLIIF